ncbi:hypothetical protein [Lentzea roselyniae]|uniref:hypothetical protein n=1 Tax=Lentzea roselyniae TaxID=531940 RepID=UPI0031F94DF3
MSATTNLCIAMTMATLVLFAQQRLGLTNAGFGAFLATHGWNSLRLFAIARHSSLSGWPMPSFSDIAAELPSFADWPTLFTLKQKWQVSLAALLMRARKLGRMPEKHYTAAMKTCKSPVACTAAKPSASSAPRLATSGAGSGPCASMWTNKCFLARTPSPARDDQRRDPRRGTLRPGSSRQRSGRSRLPFRTVRG